MLFYIKCWFFIDILPDILSVLLSLLHAFGQQVFYLSVHGPEIVLRPGSYRVIQFFGQAQGNLFLLAHQYKLPELTMGCAS